MADTTPKDAPVAAATKTPTKVSGEEKKKRGCRRNYDLGNGVYRFSRTRMYHKKALYKFVGKKTEKKVRCIKQLCNNIDLLF
jgi:large subunit ribosomal protein L6e